MKMPKFKFIPGEGLQSLINDLKDRFYREDLDEENRHTFKNIGVGGDMTIVESQDGRTVVRNKDGVEFEVTGSGLTRRITRIFPQDEINEINNKLPRA